MLQAPGTDRIKGIAEPIDVYEVIAPGVARALSISPRGVG